MIDNPNAPKDFGTVLMQNRGVEELKNDLLHFDPSNGVLLLIYFTKEGIDLSYYYRTYIVTKEALWNGLGAGQPLPGLVAWDEPPDAIGPPYIDPTPLERPTKKGKVNINSLNVRNDHSLNANKSATTLRLNQVIEFYSDKQYPDPLNDTIVWVEIRTVDSRQSIEASFRWIALKYLNMLSVPTTERPTKGGAVNTDTLHLRDKASLTGAIIGSVVMRQSIIYFTDTIISEPTGTIKWAEVFAIDNQQPINKSFLDIEFLQ